MADIGEAPPKRSEFPSPLSVMAAYAAIAAALSCLALIAALHVVTPELDPSWRFLSEYQIGPNGWLMVAAFLAMALCYGALLVAIRPAIGGLLGIVGSAALLLTIVGILIAAFNQSDPITLDPAHATVTGKRHVLGAMIGIPLNPIAALLLTLALGRSPDWRPFRRPLLWSAHATWILVAALTVTMMAVVPRAGGFGPDVPTGWLNRAVVLSEMVWAIAVAASIPAIARRRSEGPLST